MKKVLVLGATGSIGKSTLSVIKNEKDFRVCAMTAHTKSSELEKLGLEFDSKTLLTSQIEKEKLAESLKNLIEKTKPDIAVNGIAGSSGLLPSVVVLESGVDLALANKESVVMAYPIIKRISEKSGAKILPVDSEHSAIFSLLNQCKKENVEKLIITASGGPFRTWTSEKIKNATLSDALNHPTWNMGVKITVDSATLANKGLEVIEACRLFDFDAKDIFVVVHPESIVHSLVRLKDGVVYAQMSEPDMRHPILSALTFPKIKKNSMKPFDFTDVVGEKRVLTFEKPRTEDFPLLDAAFFSAQKDAAFPIAFNAANEIAAQAFIDGKIGFPKIAEIVTDVLKNGQWTESVRDLTDVFEADKNAREKAKAFL